MFIDFFYYLRERGVKVSIGEWMVLLEGMRKGLHESTLEGFYRLCRAVILKDESEYDLFDLAFEDYFRDTARISKENMIAFLKANTAYKLKPEFQKCQAHVRIVAGGREQKGILRSAQLLHQALPGSTLEVKEGLFHGEYSINHPDRYAAELNLYRKRK